VGEAGHDGGGEEAEGSEEDLAVAAEVVVQRVDDPGSTAPMISIIIKTEWEEME
jgi:hypothetical protein